MPETRTLEEHQRQKREREWRDRVQQKKESMGNAERVAAATKWKSTGNDKFKAGNLHEARDYYREAVIFVEDLVDARRKERNDLLVPLYCNLAQVYLKLDEHDSAADVASKALAIAEVKRNEIGSAFVAKALFRRGLAREALGKLEEAREDLAGALGAQPGNEEAAAALASVRGKVAAEAKAAREAMGGFLNREAGERQQREQRSRRMEERRRAEEERRSERRARAEQRQQMQEAFAKLSKGEALYEQREKEMEPVRQKEKEKRQTLELEQNLLNIISDGQGKPKTDDFDDFMKKKEEKCKAQSVELDQKKKVLDKMKKEERWEEDDAWRGQRDDHRRRLEQERLEGVAPAAPKAMWESKEVARWCEQRLRDVLLGTFTEGEEDLEPSLAAAATAQPASRCGDHILKAIVTDVLKLDGDASVMRLNPHKPPVHFFDFFLKLDWEVAVVRRGGRAYRSGEELIKAAAGDDDNNAPPSVTEHSVLAGTFKLRELSSEEEPRDGAWPLETKVKRHCEHGPELEALAAELRDKLRAKVARLLTRWSAEYREHWG